MKVIYLSGPITKGNRNQHFYRSCELQRALMQNDYAVINPMLSIVMPSAWQPDMPHELWLKMDLEIISRCDMVIRMPGESVGADEEIARAVLLGLPVVMIDEDEAEDAEGIADTVRQVFQLREKEAAA